MGTKVYFHRAIIPASPMALALNRLARPNTAAVPERKHLDICRVSMVEKSCASSEGNQFSARCVKWRTLRLGHYPLQCDNYTGASHGLPDSTFLQSVTMKKPDRSLRKSYAMERMASAIDRAIGCRTGKEKERAARWAAAWGLLCGIRTEGVKLRRNDIRQEVEEGGRCPSDQIEIGASPAPVQTECAGLRECASIAKEGVPFASGIFDPASPQGELPPDVHV